jgi:hypothetical protein
VPGCSGLSLEHGEYLVMGTQSSVFAEAGAGSESESPKLLDASANTGTKGHDFNSSLRFRAGLTIIPAL